MTGHYNDQQKKTKKIRENLQNCEFAVSADHRVKLKETEKKDKYLDFAREIVIGALGSVTEGLIKRLED